MTSASARAAAIHRIEQQIRALKTPALRGRSRESEVRFTEADINAALESLTPLREKLAARGFHNPNIRLEKGLIIASGDLDAAGQRFPVTAVGTFAQAPGDPANLEIRSIQIGSLRVPGPITQVMAGKVHKLAESAQASLLSDVRHVEIEDGGLLIELAH